jgi:hypothetical protein
MSPPNLRSLASLVNRLNRLGNTSKLAFLSPQSPVDNFQRATPELPTVSHMAPTITVDIPMLRSLAAQLADLAHLLKADNDERTCIGTWVGDPKICTALKNIQHDWSHKRKELIGYLQSVSQGARAAADAYATTEFKISKAAQC